MKKVDLLTCEQNEPCSDCGDPFGVVFALNNGICTEKLCFACILELALCD